MSDATGAQILAPTDRPVPAKVAETVKLDALRRKYEGHIYVITFDSDVVKVGQSKNPKARIGQHAKTAATQGHAVINTWVSEPHHNYEANEEQLIAFCAQRWSTASGNEWFSGANYPAIVRFAKTLAFVRLSQREMEEREAEREAERKARGNPWVGALASVYRSESSEEATYTAFISIIGRIFDLHDADARRLYEHPRGLHVFLSYLRAFGRADDKVAFMHDAKDGLEEQLIDLFVDADWEFTEPRPSVQIVSTLQRAFAEVSR